MTPGDALRFLDSLQASGIKFGLENVERALARLENPHRRTPFVHVGGTNGKGSVCALLAEILSRHGLKTGLYTSPHLMEFGERIQVGGRSLSPSRLAELVSRIRRTTQGIPLTYFEFATAVALLEFAEAGVDMAVLEVGMGGRLDATNVVRPLASVITNVSLEHTLYLGRTLRAIAAEKAGIIKPGVPVVTAARGAALEAVSGRCGELGAPLLRLGRDFRLRRTGSRLDYYGLKLRLRGLEPALAGRHQQSNAALALAAAEVAAEGLNLRLSEEAVRSALREVRWPGRLERLGEAPLLLLDGAHNPAGARALAEYLADHQRGRLILVVGVLRDKDAAGLLRPLLPLADRVIACAPESERALAPERLAEHIRRLWRGKPEVAASVAQALRRAITLAAATDTVCVCGSLYTVGEARACLLSPTRRAAC
jgi:dihydrofolate synthase/folylpolyglutamate synthase